VTCGYCKRPAELVGGGVVYPHQPDLAGKKFWLCRPCDAYVGTHVNSKRHAPLGQLADLNLRFARKMAHEAFDPLWREGDMNRTEAYKWLAKHLGISVKRCHIAMFNTDTCVRVAVICLYKDQIAKVVKSAASSLDLESSKLEK